MNDDIDLARELVKAALNENNENVISLLNNGASVNGLYQVCRQTGCFVLTQFR